MSTLLRMLCVFGLLLAVESPAQAQQFWTKSALLADMFPASDAIAPVQLTLDDAQRAWFLEQLGYAPPAATYTLYQARTADHLDGWVLFDDEVGQHEPITFAVQCGPDAVILRQEIVVYREKYGADVRAARFRSQFVGKSAKDPLVAGQDVKIVSGATYSSKSMARGVKRATVLCALASELSP